MKRSAAAPLALKAAMGIAIGGAAFSTLACIWLALSPPICPFSACAPQGLMLALYNAALVAVNALLLFRMLHGSRRAWNIAMVLVALGAIADVVVQMTYALVIVTMGATNLLFEIGQVFNLSRYAWYVNGLTYDPTFGLPYNWMVVHLVVIQLPIVILLWVGRPPRKAAAMPLGHG